MLFKHNYEMQFALSKVVAGKHEDHRSIFNTMKTKQNFMPIKRHCLQKSVIKFLKCSNRGCPLVYTHMCVHTCTYMYAHPSINPKPYYHDYIKEKYRL